jgi:hypothetical protein
LLIANIVPFGPRGRDPAGPGGRRAAGGAQTMKVPPLTLSVSPVM